MQVASLKSIEVKIMGLEEGEENMVIGARLLHGVSGDSCHGKKLSPDKALVIVTTSFDDKYALYAPITLDDPPINYLGESVGMFIPWTARDLRVSKTVQLRILLDPESTFSHLFSCYILILSRMLLWLEMK